MLSTHTSFAALALVAITSSIAQVGVMHAFGQSRADSFENPALLLSSRSVIAVESEAALPAASKARFAYNLTQDFIAIYTANPTGGGLRFNSYQPNFPAGAVYSSSLLDPAGRFLFAGSENSSLNCDLITGYTVNPTTGRLSVVPGSPFMAAGSTQGNAQALALTPNGHFLYTASFSITPSCSTGNNITGFAVNQTTGILTPIPGSPFGDGNGPFRIVASPNGKFLFAADGNGASQLISVYSIDANTGALTPVGGSPFSIRKVCGQLGCSAANFLAITPPTSFLYSMDQNGLDVSVMTIAGNGGLAEINNSPFQVGTNSLPTTGVTIDPSGKYLFAMGELNYGESALNGKTGVPSLITGSPFPNNFGSMVTFNPSGGFAYIPSPLICCTLAHPYNTLFSFSPSTGLLTKPVNLRSEPGPTALYFTKGASSVIYIPTFAYATNSGSNSISEYNIDPATGDLTQLAGSPLTDINGPEFVIVAPFGNFVYTVNQNHTISGYTVGVTGGLTKISSSPFSGFAKPIAAVVDPSNSKMFVVDQGSTAGANSLWTTTIAADGSLTGLTAHSIVGTTVSAIAMDPAGDYLFVTDSGANQITSFSLAVASSGAPIATGTSPVAVTVDPGSNFAYVANSGSNNVSAFRINDGSNGLAAGLLIKVTGSPFAAGTAPSAVIAEPAGKYLYVANSGSSTISAFKINATTGGLTRIAGTFATGSVPDSLSVSYDGKHLYAANKSSGSVTVFTINTNGTLTPGTAAVAGTTPTSVASTGKTQ